MPDKTVSYVFKGRFESLTAGAAAAGRSVHDLGTKLTALDRNGAKMRQGLDTLGRGAGRFGLVAAAGLGAFVAKAANFEAAMSKVDAATHETSANMKLLSDAALDAGAKTQYSATEAAGAIEALAKAGVSTKDILAGGLSGALNLAASDGLAVADAAEIAASALTQFRLSGDQATRVADLLAAGAGKAQGGVSELGQALGQSGLVAAQTGLTIEETVGALAEFASAGLLGSDAGTAFKSMLQSLNPNSKQAADAMAELGISAYDAQGNFIGMTKFADNLQQGLSTLSVEQQNATLKTIFGSDAVRAASIIFRDGAAGVSEWQAKVNDAGFAAETAARRMDNLKGDVEQLGGALETALIGAGEGTQGPLRGLVQNSTDLVNVFNKLPGPVKDSTAGLLGIGAVTGGSLWLGSAVVGKVVATRAAMDALSLSSGRARVALGFLGRTTGVVAGLAALGVALHQLEDDDPTASIRRYTQAFAELTHVSDEATLDVEKLFTADGSQFSRIFINAHAEIDGVKDAFDALNASDFTQFADFARTFGTFDTRADLATSAFKKTDAALTGLVTSGNITAAQNGYDLLADRARAAGVSQDQLAEILPGYTAAVGAAAEETSAHSAETNRLAAETGLTVEQVDKLTESMKEQTKVTGDAFDAETNYRQALKDARKQADTNNAGIKGDSEAALENRDRLSALKDAWNGQSEAVKNNEDRYKTARKAFVDTAVAMGVPIGAARILAKTLLEMPKSKQIDVVVQTGQASTAITTLQGLLGGLRDKTVHVNVVGDRSGLFNPGAGGLNRDGTQDHDGNPKTGKGRADGGPIYGPGTATSDSIPAMLSDGEFVVRAAAVAKYGVGFFAAANQMRLAGGGSPSGLGNYIRSDLDLKFPNTLKQWNAALEKSTKLLDKEGDKRKAILDLQAGLSSAIRDSLRSDLFGKQQSTNVWMSDADRKKAGVGNVRSTLIGDIQNAQSTKVAIARLKSKGLDGAALSELLSKGSLAEIQNYAGQTMAQLADYEKLFNTRAVLSAQTGGAGATAAYGTQLAAQTAVLERVAHLNARMDATNRRLEALAKKNPHVSADLIAKAINGAVPRKRP